MTRQELINSLRIQTSEIKHKFEVIQNIDYIKLSKYPNYKSWNVLEVIEHMSRFQEYYLPQIICQVSAIELDQSALYRPGVFGNFMVKGLLPQDEKIKMKVKTFKRMDPFGTVKGLDAHKTILRYEILLQEMRNLIEKAEKLDLNRKNIVSAVGPIIKFKIGDALRILAAHDLRHFKQCENILKA
jgi:hypothetical protein